MSNSCTHLPGDLTPPQLTTKGCQDCLAAGSRAWVHLRFCQECGHVGCCDNSPGTHATNHHDATGHEVVRSYEPGEDWWYCYADEDIFEIAGAPAAPSHTDGPWRTFRQRHAR